MAAIESALNHMDYMGGVYGDRHGYNRRSASSVAAINAGQRTGCIRQMEQSNQEAPRQSLIKAIADGARWRHAHALRANVKDYRSTPAFDQKRVPRRGLGERGVFDRVARCRHVQRQVEGFHWLLAIARNKAVPGHPAALRREQWMNKRSPVVDALAYNTHVLLEQADSASLSFGEAPG